MIRSSYISRTETSIYIIHEYQYMFLFDFYCQCCASVVRPVNTANINADGNMPRQIRISSNKYAAANVQISENVQIYGKWSDLWQMIRFPAICIDSRRYVQVWYCVSKWRKVTKNHHNVDAKRMTAESETKWEINSVSISVSAKYSTTKSRQII